MTIPATVGHESHWEDDKEISSMRVKLALTQNQQSQHKETSGENSPWACFTSSVFFIFPCTPFCSWCSHPLWHTNGSNIFPVTATHFHLNVPHFLSAPCLTTAPQCADNTTVQTAMLCRQQHCANNSTVLTPLCRHHHCADNTTVLTTVLC